MASAKDIPLRDLKEDPFELLQELERRSQLNAAAAGAPAADPSEWVGVGCLLADERFLIERNQVREVMMMPSMVTRVPGSKEWVAGLANLRGQLLPIIDLRQFLGAGSSRGALAARVLVTESKGLLVGIIVDEVFGFRRFSDSEFAAEIPQTGLRCERYLDGACTRGTDVWPVLNLNKLMHAKEFLQAAA
jgi:twitching motility protein PilI